MYDRVADDPRDEAVRVLQAKLAESFNAALQETIGPIGPTRETVRRIVDQFLASLNHPLPKHDQYVLDYMAKNQIFDHPYLGFCKLGDVTYDAKTKMMAVSMIPVKIVFDVTIEAPK